MKIRTGHKFVLYLVSAITAAVLCTLPFLAVKKDTLYVYTNSPELLSSEQGFIRELKLLGINVIVNGNNKPEADSYGLWFKNPEYVAELDTSPAKINFLYTEAYYPIEWKDKDKHPVVLTPYRELYEHYVRSNIKTAQLALGVNTTDFYAEGKQKKYPLVYVGDNNKVSPIAEFLQQRQDVKFIGAFWPKEKTLPINEKQASERRKALSQTKIVVVYNAEETPASKKIPNEVLEAVAAGALVLSSPNAAISETFGENVVIYEDETDLSNKYQYYLAHNKEAQNKIIAAQNILTEKLSSKAAAVRFKKILDWLKENNIR